MLTRMMESNGIKRPMDVNADAIHECILSKRQEGAVDATISKYLRGWRAFFNFLRTEGYLTSNPFDKVAKIKSERRIIETFSKPQIKQLLETPKK